jgi:hypothetical protein
MRTKLMSFIPDETELLAAAQQANAQHLKLLTNGVRAVLSPISIQGYWPIVVKVKNVAERLAV